MLIKLTKGLKDWAVKELSILATATDVDFQKAIAKALGNGKLTTAKYAELTGTAAKAKKNSFVDALTNALNKGVGKKTDDDKGGGLDLGFKSREELDAYIQSTAAKGVKSDNDNGNNKSITPESVLVKAGSTSDVRIVGAFERYDNTHKKAFYPDRAGLNGDGSQHMQKGMPAMFGKTPLDHPSDLDKALSSAWLKFTIEKQAGQNDLPRWARMTDHDRDLVQYALNKMKFSGLINCRGDVEGGVKVHRRTLNEFEIKAVLDDTISGGIEISPTVFDDAIILTPVLFGELFPNVNVVNVTKGRRMKGGAMANPTFTSGVAEGSAIQPFNTQSMVTAFDTSIFPAVGAIELGADFEEDSAVDLGAQIIEAYGRKALEWLDRVIAVGDGVTEPTGIFTATNTTAVLSQNGPAGPLTVNDLEALMFGLQKQFRTEPGAMPVYLSNDTMYRKTVGIPVGAGDQRRVFGMNHGDYTILQRPYKVQNNIATGRMAFANLKRYRMYRRLGLSVRVETAGRQLALTNTKLIVLRMRFGGQPELGGAFAVMNDASAS